MKVTRSVIVAALALVLIASLTGCNTTKGAGKDIEKAGAAVKNSADRSGAD